MAELSAEYGCFSGEDGVSIFYRKYEAEGEKARMIIAHGLGEHSGRYDTVVSRLLPRGISIWAADHRGHGQSDGLRGHVSSFYQYVDDLHSLVALSRDTLPSDAKIFLLGHSLGGLIALRFASRFPEVVDGVIISSPSLGLPEKLPAVKAFVGGVMSSIWPTLSLANGLDASKLSHDEQWSVPILTIPWSITVSPPAGLPNSSAPWRPLTGRGPRYRPSPHAARGG